MEITEKKVETKRLHPWSRLMVRNSAPPLALFWCQRFPKRLQGGAVLAPIFLLSDGYTISVKGAILAPPIFLQCNTCFQPSSTKWACCNITLSKTNLNNDRCFVILYVAQNDDEEPKTFQCNVVSDSRLVIYTLASQAVIWTWFELPLKITHYFC